MTDCGIVNTVIHAVVFAPDDGSFVKIAYIGEQHKVHQGVCTLRLGYTPPRHGTDEAYGMFSDVYGQTYIIRHKPASPCRHS